MGSYGGPRLMLRLLPFALMVLALGFLAAQPEGAGLHGQRAGNIGIVVLPTINTVTFRTPFRYTSNFPAHTVNADGMANTWADDDVIYINLDDTPAGFDQQVSGGRNTMFGKMTTYDTTAIGSNWNTMDAWGTENQKTGSDNSSHKIAGVISVQGTMYAWAWRYSGSAAGGASAQLLKSINHATAWTPSPPSIR